MRKLAALTCAVLFAAGILVGCGPSSLGKTIRRPSFESEEIQFKAPSEGDPIAIFDTSAGQVRAVLYPHIAPMAVDNFTGLAQKGYYDGTLFHRVLFGFAVQGGDASGSGLSGSSIWNNHAYPKEISDQLHHYSGALCAAFSPDAAVSGLSQFYFVQSLPDKLDGTLKQQMEQAGTREAVIEAYSKVGGLPYLDYTDTVFGQIYEGMDIVDQIAQVDVDENGKPVNDVVLNHVFISTYGAPDPEPAQQTESPSSSA